MLNAYFDTSVIVPLLTNDVLTERAMRFVEARPMTAWVSDFAAAEFASVIARRVRMRVIKMAEAREVFTKFDSWRLFETESVVLAPDDVRQAATYIRRLDLTLLAPDALHIAMARRVGAALVTFDAKMAASGRALGVEIAEA